MSIIDTFIAHSKNPTLETSQELYHYYVTTAKVYWNKCLHMIENNEASAFSQFHVLQQNSSKMSQLQDFINYFKKDIHKYQQRFDLYLEMLAISFYENRNMFDIKLVVNIFVFIMRVASLDIFMDADFLTKQIIETYIEYYHQVYFLVNGTGEFTIPEYLQAYKHKVFIIGIPSCASVADNILLSPVAFVNHDLIHIKRQVSFGIWTTLHPVIIQIYERILDMPCTRKQNYLLNVLWIIMHEATVNNDKLLQFLVGYEIMDAPIIMSCKEYISNKDLHPMLSEYGDLFLDEPYLKQGIEVFNKCDLVISSTMKSHLLSTNRDTYVDLDQFKNFVIGFVSGIYMLIEE